jgi:D-alanyl-D-alanine carboxypeptidase
LTRPGFRRLVAIGLALALSTPAMAGAKAAPRGVLADSVMAIGGSLLHRADIGILAVSLDKGDTLVAYSESRRLIPGSNAKLFTNGAFLVRFGTDYRRATTIDARGKTSLKDSGRRVRLDGDLVLRGSGMPDVTQILSPGSRGSSTRSRISSTKAGWSDSKGRSGWTGRSSPRSRTRRAGRWRTTSTPTARP